MLQDAFIRGMPFNLALRSLWFSEHVCGLCVSLSSLYGHFLLSFIHIYVHDKDTRHAPPDRALLWPRGPHSP